VWGNWSVAQEEQADDLKTIYCARAVRDEEIEVMLGRLVFDAVKK
jgi:hypothetical protein